MPKPEDVGLTLDSQTDRRERLRYGQRRSRMASPENKRDGHHLDHPFAWYDNSEFL